MAQTGKEKPSASSPHLRNTEHPLICSEPIGHIRYLCGTLENPDVCVFLRPTTLEPQGWSLEISSLRTYSGLLCVA